MKKILSTVAAALMVLCAAAQPGGFPGGGQGRPGGQGGQNGQGGNPFGNMTQEQMQEMFRRMNEPPTDDSFEMKEISCMSAGKKLYGEAFFPKAPGKHPVIIMSHGYNGSHTSFYQMISEFAKEGYICYCYDFAGGGARSKSEGSPMEMSVASERQNLIDVVNMVYEWDQVDKKNIFILGESQGGCVSGITAPYVQDKINSAVLVYPAFCIYDDILAQYKTYEEIPEDYTLMGLKIGREQYRCFFKEGLDVYEEIVKYDGKFLILHGTNDGLVKPEYSAKAVTALNEHGKKFEFHLIFGAGHGFQGEARDLYYNYVRDFLKNNLK
ncbi:MAG: alpha/beta fold hydrolase [Bacteroidales bacterium]|jgi:dienelactone hydrolase|nr:alpha/beta fold hydrolase [Bacteroidales bacterium]MBQ9172982.1 alpha/beta fold hydrolase [Bacteroidales bacterium]MBR6415924.1 alpha/beta fold hydrolase [Bacteroidales bacterium]